MAKTLTRASRLAAILAAVATVGLMVHVLMDIAARVLPINTLHGTNDYVAYWWMVPTALFGAVVASHRQEHIEVTLFSDLTTGRANRFMAVVGAAITGLFLALLAWYGLQEALQQREAGEYSGATGVLMWPARFVVPLAAVLMLLITVAHLRDGTAQRGRDAEREGPQ